MDHSVYSRQFHLAFLISVIILYMGLSFYQLDLPGLHYDEAFEAVPAVQLLSGQPVVAFRGGEVFFQGQNFPLMTQDYIGAINTYLALPFIALLGATPIALRTMSIGVGVVTLALAYLLASRLTGSRRVGLLALSLLVVDPTFIFWNRQGVFVTAVTAPLGLGATYCWLRRLQQEGSIWWSLAGAFLWGLGLYAKFLFLWLILASVGAIVLLNLPGWVRRPSAIPDGLKRLSLVEGGMALLVFILGCWPLLLYNLQTGGTFLNITQNASTSYYGVNNLAFGANLATRFTQFVTLLNGGHLWYLGRVIHNIGPVILFFAVMVTVIIIITTRILSGSAFSPSSASAISPAAKIALFPFLVITLALLASIGTVSALWITHFALLMPWPGLAVAVGTWFIVTHPDAWRLHQAPVFKWGIGLGLGLLLLSNLGSALFYHRALAESGGLSSHSDAIYDLSGWLAQHPGQPVVAMDWGLAAPVSYLTAGQVTPTEVFGYAWQSDVQLNQRLSSFMDQPATLYLWRAPDEVIFDRSGEFKALYRPRNLEETIEEAFYERSGRPLLGVTRLVAQGTASNPP